MESSENIRVVICAIARNEENYIDEWIDYHLNLCVDSIYVYGNDWEFFPKSEKVICERLPREIKQADVYNRFLEEKPLPFDWVIFIDIDEFIHLPDGIKIKEFLEKFNSFSVVKFHWNQIYSQGVKFQEGNYSVLKRFNRNLGTMKLTWKEALNMSRNPSQRMIDGHSSTFTEISTETVEAADIPLNNTMPCIDHYFTKTYEEFEKRCMDSVGYFFDGETIKGKLSLFQ